MLRLLTLTESRPSHNPIQNGFDRQRIAAIKAHAYNGSGARDRALTVPQKQELGMPDISDDIAEELERILARLEQAGSAVAAAHVATALELVRHRQQRGAGMGQRGLRAMNDGQ